jgi:hypothetical protein
MILVCCLRTGVANGSNDAALLPGERPAR